MNTTTTKGTDTMKTLTKGDFIDAFFKLGRNNQFTMEGLEALYNHIMQSPYSLYRDLDVMSICCNYVELTPEQIESEHEEVCDRGCDVESILLYLPEHALVIPVKNGNYIIKQ